MDRENSHAPHALLGIDDGLRGHNLGKLPSRRLLSETGASTVGDCWHRTKHLDAQRYCK